MARVEIAANALGVMVDALNRLRPGTVVSILNLDGSPATTWSAVTGGVSSVAPLVANSVGVVPGFIEEGTYRVLAGGVEHRMEAALGAYGPAGGVLAGSFPNPSFAVDMATQAELNAAVIGGGATPGAGGVLSGTYPSPGFAVDMATQAELDAAAALKASVVALTAAEARIAALEVVASARVYNGTLTIGTGSLTPLTFASERSPITAGMHSTSSNTGRLVAPVAGWYLIGAVIEWVLSTAGGNRRLATLRLNGTTAIARDDRARSVGGDATNTLNTAYYLAAGAYVEALAFHDTGANLDVIAPEFWMTRVSP